MTITITFKEDFYHAPFQFEQGATIQAEYLGGGDTIRIMYQGVKLEIPTSVIDYDA